jgi:hypothetical protein
LPQGTPAAASTPQQRLPRGAAGPQPQARTTRISIDDFTKVEMRVGQVRKSAERGRRDKLLKVMVDG